VADHLAGGPTGPPGKSQAAQSAPGVHPTCFDLSTPLRGVAALGSSEENAPNQFLSEKISPKET